MVQGHLLEDAEAFEFIGNLAIDVIDGPKDAFTEVEIGFAVAQFDGLVLAGGGAAGHCRPAHHPIFCDDINFHGRVAPAIENLPGNNTFYKRHEPGFQMNERYDTPQIREPNAQ